MLAATFDHDAHIGQSVHRQDRWGYDLAHQVVDTIILAGRHANEISKAIDADRLDALLQSRTKCTIS
jgi:hypothetical protein